MGRRSWAKRFERRERRRSSMWRVPMFFAAGAFALEELMLIAGRFEADLTADRLGADAVVLQFSDGAATTVLSTIAGSMISVTGIVFSVLTLTVQYAGGAVSPRVVRTFYRDRVVKFSLGMFVGTFSYSLVLIPEISAGTTDLAVTMAVFLAILAVGAFLVMVNHVGQGLRAASMMRRVAKATQQAIDDVHPEPFVNRAENADSQGPEPTQNTAPAIVVPHAGTAGAIMAVDSQGLAKAAKRLSVSIELVHGVGDFISPGAELFHVRGDNKVNARKLRGAIAIGEERSIDQDPAFGLRILADTAIKALSPGINDPTTAVVALDQIHSLLLIIGNRDLDAQRIGHKTLGFYFDPPTWPEYLDIALVETMHIGADTFQIARRIRSLIQDLQGVLPDDRQLALDAHLATLDRLVDGAFGHPDDIVYAMTADRQGIGATG